MPTGPVSPHPVAKTAMCRPAPPPSTPSPPLENSWAVGGSQDAQECLGKVPAGPWCPRSRAGQTPSHPPPGSTPLSISGLMSSQRPRFAVGGMFSGRLTQEGWVWSFPRQPGESKHRWGLPGGNGPHGGLVGEWPVGTSRGGRGLWPRPTTFTRRVFRDPNLGHCSPKGL